MHGGQVALGIGGASGTGVLCALAFVSACAPTEPQPEPDTNRGGNPVVTRAVVQGLLPVPLRRRGQTSVGPWAEKSFRSTRVAFRDAGADRPGDILAYVGDFDPLADLSPSLILVRVGPQRPLPEADSGRRLGSLLGSDDDAEQVAAQYALAEASMAASAPLLVPPVRSALLALSPAVASVAVLAAGGVCLGIDLAAASREQVHSDLRQAAALLPLLDRARAVAERAEGGDAGPVPGGSGAATAEPLQQPRREDAATILVARLDTKRVAERARGAIEDAIALGIRASPHHDALAYRDWVAVLDPPVAGRVAACPVRDARCAMRALRGSGVPYLLGGNLSRQGRFVQARLSLTELGRGRVLGRQRVRAQLAGAGYEQAFRKAVAALVQAVPPAAAPAAPASAGPAPEDGAARSGTVEARLRERLAAAWRGRSYALDEQRRSVPARLEDFLLSPPITVDARNRPIDELLQEISRGSGVRLKWAAGEPGSGAAGQNGDRAPRVSIRTSNAPPLALAAALCERYGWDLTQHRDDGGPLLSVAPGPRRVLAHVTEGPLTMLWYGAGVNPRDEGAPSRAGRRGKARAKGASYALALLTDPNGFVRAVPASPLSQQTALITPATPGTAARASGVSASLAPQRSDLLAIPSLDGVWAARVRKPVEAERAQVGLTVPFAAPTRREHAVIPWKEGAQARAARSKSSGRDEATSRARRRVQVSVKEVKSWQSAATQHTRTTAHKAVLHLTYETVVVVADEASSAPASEPPRRASAKRLKRRRRRGPSSPRRGTGRRGTDAPAGVEALVTVVDAHVVTVGGGQARATFAVSEEPETSVPTYRVVVTHQTDDPALRPERLRLSWAVGYREVEEGLVLSQAPMLQP